MIAAAFLLLAGGVGWLSSGCGRPVRAPADVRGPSMVANLPKIMDDAGFDDFDEDMPNGKPDSYLTFGGALRPLRPLRLAHLQPLPRLARQLISPRDRLILAFVLEYIEASGMSNAAVLISGGYVRDLLLGRQSDDLDLSFCLAGMHPNTTIDTVASGMPDFAAVRPDLGIDTVEIVTALSEASRGKSVDAAQVRMTLSNWEEPAIVDLMPTIGKETYDENDRIPRRDVRGTPEEDTLRRDLTICAMLLEVTRVPGRFFGERMDRTDDLAAELERRLDGEWVAAKCGNLDRCVEAALRANALEFRLLDFHDGVSDLQAGVLRSPYPRDRSLADVWREVIVSPAEIRLAEGLGLSRTALSLADEREMLQAVWWAKVLRDDPLRLVRALRFSASLGMEVHPSFWQAVPFAVDALRAKVSGPRKLTELRKIAKAGRAALLDFFELAFEPLVAFGDDVAFGDALFGGPSADARRLSVAIGFDAARMRAAAAALPVALEPDSALGGVLAAAILCSELRGCEDDDPCELVTEDGEPCDLLALDPFAHGDQPCSLQAMLADEVPDHEMAAIATLSLHEARRACDGLCASTAMRLAAAEPLSILVRLLQPGTPVGQHYLFADAAGAAVEEWSALVPEDHADASALVAGAEAFATLVRMWDVLKLEPSLAHRQLAVGADFVVALAETRCSRHTATRLREQLELLCTPGPTISGGAVAGVAGIPPHLRGVFISQLHVLCRLRGECADFTTAEQLTAYLDQTCEGLLGRLREEWWEGGRWEKDEDGRKPTLRAAYSKDAVNAWLRAGVVLES